MRCQIQNFVASWLVFILNVQISVLQDTEPVVPADPLEPFKFMSAPHKTHHGNFVRKAMDIILSKGLYQRKPLEKLTFLEPDEMVKQFDFSLGEEGVSEEELLKIIEKLFEISPKPGHRYRLSKRVGGLDPLAVAGDWMAATMSNLVVTYQVAPIWTMMEIKMVEYLSKQIQWQTTGDGVPTSGSGTANALALAVARHHLDPTTRDIGLFHYKRKELVFYVSEHASISWKTAAIYDGFGLEAIHQIAVDEWGRMDTSDLDRQIESDKNSGRVPVMVVATAGTPSLGVIDPIDQIASICQKYKIWLHVDAEFAGGYLFSPDPTDKFRSKLAGIQWANSVLISMWLFSAPYPNSMLLTKNREALQKTFGLHAPYVFTGIDNYNMSYDMGDHTIQTSRRPEIAKIWFAAARGEHNSLNLFNGQDEIKLKFIELLKKTNGFLLLKTSENSNSWQVPFVNFYYIPQQYQGVDEAHLAEFAEVLTKTSYVIKHELQRQGLADISVTVLPHSDKPACLTIAFKHNRLSEAELTWLATTIKQIGDNPNVAGLAHTKDSEDSGMTDPYPTFPAKEKYCGMMKKILDVAYKEGIFFGRDERCFNLKQPDFFNDVSNFDFQLPYADGEDLSNKFMILFKRIIQFSPHWAHPYFIYQLAAGLDPYTLVADYVVPVLNTPMISYRDGSAPFMLMEKEVVKQILKRVYNSEEGDGTITDGGSMGNQIAIALAKYNIAKENFKNCGASAHDGKKYIIFTSEDAHYSTKKGAMLQGIGQNYTIDVQSTDVGRMRVDSLEIAIEKAITEGHIPLMIVVTTGTTIYGAIDNVDEIIEVAKKYNIWVHVDGMFGGLLVMSDNQIKKFNGIEQVDSWGADLHKLMGSAMVCTVLVTKHKGLLRKTFQLADESQENVWIDKTDSIPEELSLVGRHVQLDKRNNVFKFWLLWKAKGRKGMEAHVDTIMDNANFLVSEIKKRKNVGFELILEQYDLTNICFRYIPPYLNPDINNDVDRTSDEWAKQMDMYTFSVEKEFVKNGITSFVTQKRHSAGGDSPMFIKFVMMGSALTHDDIRYLLNAIAFHGSQIKVEPSSRARQREFEDNVRGKFEPFGNLPRYYRVD